MFRRAKTDQNTKLITVYQGRHATNLSATEPASDYFVHDGGAAVREMGFHKFLAEFIGWDLPLVTRFNGQECPLYIECIFPLLIVEQKHGWSGIQGNLPTFIGIREMGKRAIEFLLKLDAYDVAQSRQRLKQAEDFTKERWTQHAKKLELQLKQANARAHGVPAGIISGWPEEAALYLEVNLDDQWMPISRATHLIEERLSALENKVVESTAEVSPRVEADLAQERARLRNLEYAFSDANAALLRERTEIKAVTERIDALEQDLSKNKDVKKLQSWGSKIGPELTKGQCPTCHQQIADSLLGTESAIMSIDDNIAFIESQLETFRKISENIEHVISLKESDVQAIARSVHTSRTKIRAFRETLVSANSSPSVEDIRARLTTEDTLKGYREKTEAFSEWCIQANEIFSDWKRIQADKARLPHDPLTATDKAKLKQLETTFVSLLRDYGLLSVIPSTLCISSESYRPMREGFNLGFDLSASDGIRVIWGYLFSLLYLARTFQTNHPGILVFDEPKQQSANKVSFSSLLQHATEAAESNQQVFFATSEPVDELRNALAGKAHTLIEIYGKVLKILPSDGSVLSA